MKSSANAKHIPEAALFVSQRPARPREDLINNRQLSKQDPSTPHPPSSCRRALTGGEHPSSSSGLQHALFFLNLSREWRLSLTDDT